MSDLVERLRVNSCRLAHETPDRAATRRIEVEFEAADEIEKLRNQLVSVRRETIEQCAVICDNWPESIHDVMERNGKPVTNASTTITLASRIRDLTDNPDAGLPTAQDVRGILAKTDD